MNACDWWIARTLEEAIADYTRETHVGCEDVSDARELTERELDRLVFVDEEACTPQDPCHISGQPATEHRRRRSFRRELARRVEAGISGPGFFATTEY